MFNILRSTAKAQSIADRLNADDEDSWVYTVRVVNAAADLAVIDIADEDGEFVGTL
jgi:hypothetical protein